VLPVLSCGARGPPVRGGAQTIRGGGVPTRPHSWLRAWFQLYSPYAFVLIIQYRYDTTTAVEPVSLAADRLVFVLVSGYVC